MLNSLGLNSLNNKIFFGLQNKDYKLNYHLIGNRPKLKMDKLHIQIQEQVK